MSRFLLQSVHPTVHPSAVALRGWKVWWFIALCCCCHVHWHVRSILEEEVICAELQSERQDVYPGTSGFHVSYLLSLWAWHTCAFQPYLSLSFSDFHFFVNYCTDVFYDKLTGDWPYLSWFADKFWDLFKGLKGYLSVFIWVPFWFQISVIQWFFLTTWVLGVFCKELSWRFMSFVLLFVWFGKASCRLLKRSMK